MKQASIIQAAMVAGLSLFLPGVQAFLPGCQTCTMRQRSGEVVMRSGYEDARTDRRASVAQVCHTGSPTGRQLDKPSLHPSSTQMLGLMLISAIVCPP